MNDGRFIRGGADVRNAHGTCGLCGAHDRDLYMIAAGDYIGWACGECRRQLSDSFIRQFCAATEQTEPEE